MLSAQRFSDLCRTLAPRLDARAAFAALNAAYTEPARAYHNASHISDCLAQFDSVRSQFDHPAEAEFALWYHDVVYDSRAKDNEERSAQLAASVLRDGGASPESIGRVEQLILATRHAQMPTDRDAHLIVDIDLSILGRNDATFDTYDTAIRREYSWVPEDKYREGRSVVLRGFLARPRIYTNQTFFEKFETCARENMERALRALAHPSS